MYRYIGNKTKLLTYIMERTGELIGNTGTVVDLMAGTGSVAVEYRRNGYTVIANDVMTYSLHHLRTNLLLEESPDFDRLFSLGNIGEKESTRYEDVIEYLNAVEPKESFFFKEFSPGGKPECGCDPRKYFTTENAKKIDAIREQINDWIENGLLSDNEESLLKHTLIMAVNEVANISGTYGYFLSDFKKNSLNALVLKPEAFFRGNSIGHRVLQGFAEDNAANITADLCYIDPPYMKRQYAANYHILETIAKGDYPDAIGKSGLRDWWDQHSKLCTKTRGLQAFDKILTDINCPKFIISYSEDGIFTIDQLKECFEKYGKVTINEIDYNRFKSNWSRLPKKITEYLITIEMEE